MSIVPSRRALVVDDSRAARVEAARLIEPFGFDVDLVDDGLAALKRLEERGTYDLVLVDLRMPSLDGHELVRLMRARANFTPVVVMTASAETRLVVATLKLGATDFLVKPLEPAMVKEALARALNLPSVALRAETPRVLAVGPQPLADTIAAALPPYVEVDRTEREGLADAVLQRPYRLVVMAARAPPAGATGEVEREQDSAAAAGVLAVQPGAALCLVAPDGGALPGFDAAVAPAELGQAIGASLYPNAVRPLVMHDEALVVVSGFRAAPETESTYFAVAGRRLRLAVALQAAAGAPRLTVDLSRVPVRSAAVERLAAQVVEAAAGRPEVRLSVAPALCAAVERLGLGVAVEAPEWQPGRGAVFRWTPDLAVGVESIDAQHQELFSRTGALVAAMRTAQADEAVDEALAFLARYTQEHFTDEEALMAEAGFPGQADHRAQHQAFRASLQQLAAERRRDGLTGDLRLRLEREVCLWLYQHVQRTDRALGQFLTHRR